MVRVGRAVGMSSSSSEMETNSSLEGPCEFPVITDDCEEPSVTAADASCGVFGTNSFAVGPSLGSLLDAPSTLPLFLMNHCTTLSLSVALPFVSV